MDYKGKNIGFAITGSFCTLEKIREPLIALVDKGANVIPIFSEMVSTTDTRFGNYDDLKQDLEKITGNKIIKSIKDAEPIGPKALLDILIVCPCTGNTLAKIANGITDSTVTMAVKAHLRNNRPVVIHISTNDGLGINAKNIGILLNRKNFYFVPFGQDNAINKNNSLVALENCILETLEKALDKEQLQPLLRSN